MIAGFTYHLLVAHVDVERRKAHVFRQAGIDHVGFARENAVQEIKFIVRLFLRRVADLLADLVRAEFLDGLLCGQLVAAVDRVHDAILAGGRDIALRQRPLLEGVAALFAVLVDVQDEPASAHHVEIRLVALGVEVCRMDIFPYQRCALRQPGFGIVRQRFAVEVQPLRVRRGHAGHERRGQHACAVGGGAVQ